LNIIVEWQARRASLSELAITTQRWIADSNAATTADPEGGPFQRDDDILIDEFYAREKTSRGDTLNLIAHDWHVAGVFESGKLARICVRLPVLQQITGNPNHLSQIYQG
jgi:hypothetical protein